MKSNFRPRTLNSSNRKSFTINQFLGVDYSTHKFEIAENRAIDILNYMYKDGAIQNRNGITQLCQINEIEYYRLNFNIDTIEAEISKNTTNINSIWQFVAEDGQLHIIAHIGKLLFEIKNIDDEDTINLTPIHTQKKNNFPVCYEYENFKSQAFIGGNKLWFLGGNKYMVLRFTPSGLSIMPVEESNLVQIPTTTISITYANAITSNRHSLDNVNLLTKWRKNKLLSGVGKNNNVTTKNYEYTLDSPLVYEKETDMTDFEMIIEERGVIDNG